MSRTSTLYDLQLIDNQIDQRQNRLQVIVNILNDTTEIKSAEARQEIEKKALTVAENDLKSAEKKVKEQRIKINRTDSMLYSGKISNPKELKDLQDENEALKRYLEVLEDRQLERMLEVDEAKDRHSSASDFLFKVKDKFDKLFNELIIEKTLIEAEIQTLETRRRVTASLISPEDLHLYEILRAQGHGISVSKVQDRACSACGATLSAALYQASRSPNQISRCETCDRILYN